MIKLTFEDVKNQITTEQVIDIVEELGGIYDEAHSTSKYLLFSSFLYNIGDSENHKFKLYYYLDNNTFHDYKLGISADIFELVVMAKEEIEGIVFTSYDALEWVAEKCGLIKRFNKVDDSPPQLYNFNKDLKQYLRKKNNDDNSDLTIYDESILNQYTNQYHQSWIDDNISIESMKKYNIKYDYFNNRIVIPCYNENNQFVGARCRNVNPEKDWKYMPLTLMNGKVYNFPTGKVLYGLNHTKEAIQRFQKAILLESEKGVLQAETYLGKNNIAVGLFGSALTDYKLHTLLKLGINEIIIGIDYDYEKVGEGKDWELYCKKIVKMINMIKPYCRATTMIEYDKHPLKSSPTDLGYDEFHKLYNTRKELILR